MQHSRTSALVLLIPLGLAACAPAGIDLATLQTDALLTITITNNTPDELVHQETIYTGRMRPGNDIVLLFEKDGEYFDACAQLDGVPTARMTIPHGGKFTFTASVTQLSEMFCLEAGQAYELRALYLEMDGDGFRVVERSNPRSLVASPAHRITRRSWWRITSDGMRFEPERRAAPLAHGTETD